MQITLRHLSDPGFQRGVAEDAGCHQSTVSRVVGSTVEQICAGANRWIKFPTAAAEVQQPKEAWRLRRTFPSCIGAIDCTHVRIEKRRGGRRLRSRGAQLLLSREANAWEKKQKVMHAKLSKSFFSRANAQSFCFCLRANAG
jgi:hypothetical protein